MEYRGQKQGSPGNMRQTTASSSHVEIDPSLPRMDEIGVPDSCRSFMMAVWRFAAAKGQRVLDEPISNKLDLQLGTGVTV